MRIGIDCRMYSDAFTGIGKYAYELVEWLQDHDQENDYVLFFNEPQFTRFEPRNPRFKKVCVAAPHYSLKEQLTFPRVLAQQKCDLVHFTHFNAPLFWRGPTVVTIHDLTLSFYPGKKMTSWWQRLAYRLTLRSVVRRAREVIAISQHTRKDLLEVLGIPSDRVRVIHNGIDVVPFARARADTPARDAVLKKYRLEPGYTLYAGVWRTHKNIVRLIRAVDLLRKRGKHVRLVLAGKEDPTYHEVRDTIKRLDLGTLVRPLGYVDGADLPFLYAGAAAFAFPSLYEGFGLPVLEAMAANVPVACSKTSSLPEIAGQNGARFFDPFREESIADALSETLFDEKLRSQLTTAGNRRVQDFSWATMGALTLAAYRDALAKK